jgi:hypothetical protein
MKRNVCRKGRWSLFSEAGVDHNRKVEGEELTVRLSLTVSKADESMIRSASGRICLPQPAAASCSCFTSGPTPSDGVPPRRQLCKCTAAALPAVAAITDNEAQTGAMQTQRNAGGQIAPPATGSAGSPATFWTGGWEMMLLQHMTERIQQQEHKDKER